MVCIVSMKALDPRFGASHSATRTVGCIRRDESIPLGLVAAMSCCQRACKLGVAKASLIESLDVSRRFETRHPFHRQGAGQPIPGGKRCAIVEKWRDFDDNR
jgi:hypothetical protein